MTARYEWLVENAYLGSFANDGKDVLQETLTRVDAAGFEILAVLPVKYPQGCWAKIVAKRPRT